MALNPPESLLERVRTAVHGSVTAEFATAGGGRPMVYPLTPFYDEERECVVVTSPPAYAGKVDAVRENPTVALHCYGGGEDGRGLLVRGTATVDDEDVRANGEYVARLIADEPDGEKREAFSDSGVLDSRLGRLLMDWYTLRVVVRIDPTEATEVPDLPTAPSVPAWPAAGLDAGEAAKQQRLSLGLVGGDGERPTPTPVRGVDVDPAGEVATLQPVAPVTASEGDPVCLLMHWHTPDVKRLGQRVVRGRVVDVEDGRVRLRAGSHFSMRRETRLDLLRAVLEGKRRTRAYFGESGLTGWFW